MKYLIKVTTILVYGHGGNSESYSYNVSDVILPDEKEITQYEVVEADELYLEYKTYENLGEITESEIETLVKYCVINN